MDRAAPAEPVSTDAGAEPKPISPTRLAWVPIRALTARHRTKILEHLLALSPADRYLRFGSAATDAQIAHYVDLIDFDGDDVFGIFNRKLDLLAIAHLAYGRAASLRRDPRHGPISAEFGVSVLAKARGRGYGSRLFDRAVLHARNRDVERLVIHALSENKTMLAIARQAGARVVRDGSESLAELELPPDDVGSHVEALVEHAAAEIDFRIKANAHRVGHWLFSLSAAADPHHDASAKPTPAATDEPHP